MRGHEVAGSASGVGGRAPEHVAVAGRWRPTRCGRSNPAGALVAEHDTDWRTGYLCTFRRLVEAGLGSKDAAVSVARGGLESVHRQMRVVHEGGEETEGSLLSAPAQRLVGGATACRAPGRPKASCPCPTMAIGCGAAVLAAQVLDMWGGGRGTEPLREAVRTVAAHPQAAPAYRTVVALGAVPKWPCSRCWAGAPVVIAIDPPGPLIWERLADTARGAAAGGLWSARPPATAAPGLSDQVAQRAGLDLLRDVPAIAEWLAAADGPLVLGKPLTPTARPTCASLPAADALTVRLQAAAMSPWAFLATPTDVFAVPAEAVTQSARGGDPVASSQTRRRDAADDVGRASAQPRLLHPRRRPRHQRQPGGAAGPWPYALAKRLHRFMCHLARISGATVSMNPPRRRAPGRW